MSGITLVPVAPVTPTLAVAIPLQAPTNAGVSTPVASVALTSPVADASLALGLPSTTQTSTGATSPAVVVATPVVPVTITTGAAASGVAVTVPVITPVTIAVDGTPTTTGVDVTTPVGVGVGVDLNTASGLGAGVSVTTPVTATVNTTVGVGSTTTGGVDLTVGLGGGTGVGVGVGVGSVGVGTSGGGSTGGSGSGGVGVTVGLGGGSSGDGGVTVGAGAGGGSTSGGDGSGGAGGGTSSGGSGAAAPVPDPTTAYVNIFRLASSAEIGSDAQAQLSVLQQQVNTGALTASQAVLKVADMAAGATSVAVASYQFFSGLTPTAEGLTFLEHSSANPTDLSDAYYAPFNLENRYINFASNLGLHSDYAPQFAQDFGTLSFQQTVATAYDRIVGLTEARAAGIDPQAAIADIASRQAYFQQVAHERFGGDNQDLSTKLAAVAYIMQEAVRADVGRYGQAEQNFLFDLADGKAQEHVDLVGTYGHHAPTNMTS